MSDWSDLGTTESQGDINGVRMPLMIGTVGHYSHPLLQVAGLSLGPYGVR